MSAAPVADPALAAVSCAPPLGGAGPVPAPAAPAPDAAARLEQRLQELEETVRRQQEVIRRLEETVEALRKGGSASTQPAPASPSAGTPADPPVGTGASPPRAALPDPRLRLRGYIQMDARFFPSGSGRTANESFLLRRVRLILSGELGKLADYTVQPSFDEGTAGLLDAFVNVHPSPQLQFQFGKFKTPFSLERLQSASSLGFVARSVSQNLAPNRDVGAMLHGSLFGGRLEYALAALNGAADGANADGDAGRDKDFAGRLFAQPFSGRSGSELQGLALGLAATYGVRDEAVQVMYRAADRTPFFTYTADVSADGASRRLAPQFYYHRGPLGLMGEAYLNRLAVRRPGAAATLSHHGWFVQSTYVLTGEPSGFGSLSPRRPFDLSRGQWGALEVGVRYSRLDLDAATFRLGFADPVLSARAARVWTVGLNWYLTDELKFQLNYEHTGFPGAIRFAPGPRDHQDLILTRLQFVF